MCRLFHDWYTDAPAIPEKWPTADKRIVRAWIEAVVEHPFVKHVVGGAARSLCPRPRYGAPDRDDMKQDLVLALVRALPRFDPARRAHVFWFVQVVIMNAARKVWRHRGAKKRQVCFEALRDVARDLRRPALNQNVFEGRESIRRWYETSGVSHLAQGGR